MKRLVSLLVALGLLSVASAQVPRSIDERLQGKTAIERVDIKSQEIAESVTPGTFQRGSFRIDIQSVETIKGGVEVFAKAWKNGRGIGFGDGTIEIERFRIYNPPVLVEDKNGTIVRQSKNIHGEVSGERRLREDPQEALLQVLEHNLTVMNLHDDTRIVSGKVGRTTSTFFSNPGTGTNGMDSGLRRLASAESWNSIVTGGGTNVNPNDTEFPAMAFESSTSTNLWVSLFRGHIGFDTSGLPDTDAISSATLSLYKDSVNASVNNLGIAATLNIFQSSPASDSTVAAGDYQNVGSTDFSSDIAFASWAAGYNDFVLNASGIANIEKTGTSNFASRDSTYDAPNSAPTWSSNKLTVMYSHSADRTGTTNDPKLVVEHAAASRRIIITQ